MKINFSRILIPVAVTTYLFGYHAEFFAMLAFAFLHELGHIFMARSFGAHTLQIKITPIGILAVIHNLQKLPTTKKALILLSGPFVNIFFFTIFFYAGYDFLWQLNLALAVFNMLPVYPLDGGGLLATLLESRLGTINSGMVVLRTSKLVTYIIFALGIIQVIMFPFNVSLLAIAIFLKHASTGHYSQLSLAFYNIISAGYKSKAVVNTKLLLVDANTPLVSIANNFSPQTFHIVYFTQNQRIVRTMN